MTTRNAPNLSESVLAAARRKPIAACCVALFALTAPEAFAANTWTVTNCGDSGSGSLRDIVANSAASGDTVVLSSCVTGIGLTSGAIQVAQNDLTLYGAPSGSGSITTVTGYYNGGYQPHRVFVHTGIGTLSLNEMRISYGKPAYAGIVKGGCIYSNGNVSLSFSQVLGCTATSTDQGRAYGGAVYAKGNLLAVHSQIAGNSLVSTGTTFGGAAKVNGSFTSKYSTINGNSADIAGGIDCSAANVRYSTISGNTAASWFGGMYVVGDGTGNARLTISSSTISGNVATNGFVGGVKSRVPTTVQNSTIAFNKAATNLGLSNEPAAPGLALVNPIASPATAYSLNLQSSIISNNTYGSSANEDDISTAVQGAGDSFTITSNNNLIRAATGSWQPATVSTACPLLGPLRANGGSTLTHALLSHSPAIDAGNNSAGWQTDQRGFARSSGPTDIGAYEVQQSDVIFNASFEGCPVLF